MKRFVIENEVFEMFPHLEIGVLSFKNVNNSGTGKTHMLETACKSLCERLASEDSKTAEYIKEYSLAMKKFKTKKGARCSIEALLKRAEKGNPVSSINTLVDIYNAVSLRFALPCGAEDIDTFAGDLHLTITEGNDSFYLIGDTEPSPTLKGELCYKDDIGAVCRCFNWRDGERTMITDKTKNAFIVIELLAPEREEDLRNALKMLEEKCQKYLNGDVKTAMLTIDNAELELQF